jgi:long-chain acyl-CoA synthetase
MQTFAELLRNIESSSSNPTAFNARTEKGWHSISTENFLNFLKKLTLGLYELGVRKGTRVGILAQPSPYWTMADLAIILCGGVSVPLFANISDENFVYETTQTELKIIFIDGQEQWAIFEKHLDLFDLSIAIDGSTNSHPKLMNLNQVWKTGETLDQKQPALYTELLDAQHPDDLATIIYTSGSTGIPKGVQLTQKNLLCVIHFSGFHWNAKTDRYLNILPLAHVLGHCINLWMLAWGVSIYYFNDYKKLSAICQEITPTAIVVVPRILEKIYTKIIDQLHTSKGIKRTIGEWAFSLAKKKKRNLWDKILFPVADALIFSKLRKALGGKIRVVISGGAPLNPRLLHFYTQIGIPIYEGWGLTEACPVCVNYPGKSKPGSVGPIVLEEQKIRISQEGEILVNGPLVMKGYYRNPHISSQALDQDGWLHTGDRGVIDSEGFLFILGRMKELYKTSTGEYVAPVPIEQTLTHCSLIDMAMVIAEGRKFTSCLLFPNPEVLHRMKVEEKAEQLTDQSFLQSRFIKEKLEKFLNEINKHLNHWEQIHNYRFILQPLTIQNGELTSSMKIRREVVSKKYEQLIEEMYQEEEE